jgi:hypothetical protein
MFSVLPVILVSSLYASDLTLSFTVSDVILVCDIIWLS